MAETTIQTLQRETEVARNLLSHMADILDEDAQLKADTIEGQTNLVEAIGAAGNRILELESMEDALEIARDRIDARLARFKKQRENLRTAICVALELADVKRLETPTTTVVLVNLPQKAEVTNEALIPAKFWKPQDPRLDKKALLAALNAKEEIPGAVLSNGGVTVQLKTG